MLVKEEKYDNGAVRIYDDYYSKLSPEQLKKTFSALTETVNYISYSLLPVSDNNKSNGESNHS